MCRSIETSLATFLVSTGCMALAVKMRPTREIKFLAIVVITFAFMQIVDALIWFGIQNKKDWLNKLTSTFLVPVVLAAELLVSYYAAKHFLGWSNRVYEIALWGVVIVLLSTWVYDCMKSPLTKTNADGYLVWCNVGFHHIPRIVFLICILLPFLFAYPNGWIKTAVILLCISTWLWNYTNIAFGSRWCWSSNIVSVVVLLMVLLRYK